jgi:hypothetical protein
VIFRTLTFILVLVFAFIDWPLFIGEEPESTNCQRLLITLLKVGVFLIFDFFSFSFNF